MVVIMTFFIRFTLSCVPILSAYFQPLNLHDEGVQIDATEVFDLRYRGVQDGATYSPIYRNTF